MELKVWFLLVSLLVASATGRYIDLEDDEYTYRRKSPPKNRVPVDLRFGPHDAVRCQVYVPQDIQGAITRTWNTITNENGPINRALKDTIGSKIGRMWTAFMDSD